MEKEKWISEKMDSLDNMRAVEPPPFLFHRLETKIKKLSASQISMPWAIGLAASFLLLLTMNLLTIAKKDHFASTKPTSEAAYFQLNSQSTNTLYE